MYRGQESELSPVLAARSIAVQLRRFGSTEKLELCNPPDVTLTRVVGVVSQARVASIIIANRNIAHAAPISLGRVSRPVASQKNTATLKNVPAKKICASGGA
jgi:hypothetical protein